MFALTLGSLRHRIGGYSATFITMFLGAIIVMTFASLVDTRTPGLDQNTLDSLIIMPSVVGGWGLVIVTFAVTSTLTLVVRQRNQEMALLKSIGATPAQIGRLIVGESAAVAVLASALAIVPAIFTGEWLLSLLKDTGQVADGVPHQFGPIAIGMGVGITVLAAMLAAGLATRRTVRIRAREAMLAASVETPKLGKVRVVAGIVALVGGLNCAVLTVTVLDAAKPESMAIAAEGAILSSIGLALLGPALLRAVLAAIGAPLRRFSGAGGYLTVHNIRERAKEMGGALAPIILFTGIATGTLYMQSIENDVIAATQTYEGADTVQTLNLVVVGMIAVFTAVLVVNTLIATTTYRRREFGQQRLAGSTPRQLLRMVGLESTVIATTAVLFGSLAAVVTIVPYSILKTDEVLPDTSIAVYLGIVALAGLLTFGASIGSARRTIRTPAIRAVGAVA